MPRSCPAKHALQRGMRPVAHQKLISGVCSRRCIFCDIWKLATVVATHVPLSTRYNGSFCQRISRQTPDFDRAEKSIEVQLQAQRARVASIMSISTVEGAEQSEGLRIAHDRALSTIRDLLFQEAQLEEKLKRPAATPVNSQRRASRDASCAIDSYPYGERRSSRVGIAI